MSHPLHKDIKRPSVISHVGIPGEFYLTSDIDALIDDLEYQIKGLTIDRRLFESIQQDVHRLSGHIAAITCSL